MNKGWVIFYLWTGLFFTALYLLPKKRLLIYDLALLQSAKWGIIFKISNANDLKPYSNELSHNLKGFINKANL